jgi:hypothetical protein
MIMGVLSEKEITRGGFVPKAVSNPQRSVVIKKREKVPHQYKPECESSNPTGPLGETLALETQRG